MLHVIIFAGVKNTNYLINIPEIKRCNLLEISRNFCYYFVLLYIYLIVKQKCVNKPI